MKASKYNFMIKGENGNTLFYNTRIAVCQARCQ